MISKDRKRCFYSRLAGSRSQQREGLNKCLLNCKNVPTILARLCYHKTIQVD